MSVNISPSELKRTLYIPPSMETNHTLAPSSPCVIPIIHQVARSETLSSSQTKTDSNKLQRLISHYCANQENPQFENKQMKAINSDTLMETHYDEFYESD